MTETEQPPPLAAHAVGVPTRRLDGPAKVSGTAPYAWEHRLPEPVYVHAVQAGITRGRIARVDAAAAEAVDGVLTVLSHRTAPRLADTSDHELAILQGPEVGFRGQIVGAVLAETPEAARYAASLVQFAYEQEPHHTELRGDSPDTYTPEKVSPSFPSDTEQGDPEAALDEAACTVDATYRTPMQFNNPMEPHTTIAIWEEGDPEDPSASPVLTLYDSTQGSHTVRTTLAPMLGLGAERVRVISPHVGGGFGSKGMPHAHNVLACLAAKVLRGRPAKLALTRQQLFSLAGHRTPTVQRVRLGAEPDGRLTAISHEVLEHTSRVKEFAEQSAVATRMMYASPNRRTAHRLAALDVPVPSWMRAPGETPGMYAAEVAMDELAEALGLDPIELRKRNDPAQEPETGKPWSSRHLVECLTTGARRFGWDQRTAPGARREGEWLVGLGVASSTYPGYAMPGSEVEIVHRGSSRYTVRIGAADLGTGTWTVLSQIAADGLGVAAEDVRMEIGDTAYPMATVAGGSSGVSSWGSSLLNAVRAFRDQYGDDPEAGARVRAGYPKNPARERYAVHSFGAHFAEARVNAVTGEVRVPRMLGVFSAGRIINPLLARSQFIGGMTMGLSMALHEEGVFDHATGHVVNQDLADYHVAACADIGDIEAAWLDEEDFVSNPMGSRGIGEIGIVGSPSAVVNAVYNATGIRVRELPLTPDKLLGE